MSTTWRTLRVGRAVMVFSDRTGGVSEGPFTSANLGSHVGDDVVAVMANRGLLLDVLASLGGPARWTSMQQVHGTEVHVVTDRPRSTGSGHDDTGSGDEGGADSLVGDGLVTDDPGVAIAVVVADCGPIALVSEGAVGVVHCGWPGLRDGVIERGVATLLECGGGTASTITAVLGPCIRPCCYEFGADTMAPIRRRLGDGVVGRTREGSLALDLPAGIRTALHGIGVGHVVDLGVCTGCSDLHFSHRRDGRARPTGRQAVAVKLTRDA